MKRVVSIVIALLLVTSSAESHLGPVADRLCSVARLTNWIAIQTNYIGDARRILDVSAELVGVESGKVLEDMAGVRVNRMADELDKLATLSVGNVSVSGTMVSSLNALNANASECVRVAESGMKDPIEEFKTTKKKASSRSQMWSTVLNTAPFVTVSRALRFIHTELNIRNIPVLNQLSNELLAIKSNMTKIVEVIGLLADYQNDMKSLLLLNGASLPISNMMVVVKVLKGSKDFATLAAELGEVKTSVSSLIPIAKGADSMGSLAGRLENVQKAMGALSHPPSAVSLTLGLPNKTRDLDRVLQDLQESWIRESVADGKEFGQLEALFAPLAPFSLKIKSLASSVAAIVPSSNSSRNPSNLHKLLSEASVEGAKLQNVQDLETSVDGIHKCVADLKTVNTQLDFDKIEKAINYAISIDMEVQKLQEAMENVLNLTEIRQNNTKFGEIEKIISDGGNLTEQDTVNGTVHRIRNITDVKVLMDALETVVAQLRPFPVKKLEDVLRKDPNWDALSKVETAFEEANLQPVLECLSKSKDTNSLNGVDSVLKFGETLRAIDQKDIAHVSAQLRAVPQFQKAMKEVRNTTGGMQMPEAPQVAEDVGKGVGVIRKMNEVLVKKSALSQAIDSFKGQQQWTTAKTEEVNALVAAVETLDAAAKPLMADGKLSDIWNIFSSAEGVSKVAADTKLFRSLISSNPSNSSNSLLDLSTLELDFTGARLNLKAASLALPTLTSFFDTFFHNEKRTVTPLIVIQQAPESIRLGSIIIWVVRILSFAFLIFIACATIGLFIWRRARKRLMKDKKEKPFKYFSHAGLKVLAHEENYETVMRIAVKTGLIKLVQRAIDCGAYIDGFGGGPLPSPMDTPLHSAITYRFANIVELLIKSGANRNLYNNEKNTPEQWLMIELHQLESKQGTTRGEKMQLEQLKKIKSVFEKLKGRVFQPKIPDLLPTKHYLVELGYVYHDIYVNKFAEKYKDIVLQPEDMRAVTHTVVQTSVRDACDFDQLLRNKNDSSLIHGMNTILNAGWLVKVSWITECIEDKKNLHNDYEHRVQNVIFDGFVYPIDEWKKDAQLRRLGYLTGANVMLVGANELDWRNFGLLVRMLGGTFHSESFIGDPKVKDGPLFFHPDEKSRFIVHASGKAKEIDLLFGGAKNVKKARTDFNILTLRQFFAFVLERRIDEGSREHKEDPNAKKTAPASTASTSSTALTSSAAQSPAAQHIL